MIEIDLAAVFLPLLAAVVVGLFGRTLGDRTAQIVTCGAVSVAALFSIIIFNDVALHGAVRTHILGSWIDSGAFHAEWALKIDTLAAVMLVVVNGVSAMVHIYSVGYMSHDKSIPRFMAYLSLFTFFMLMLVTANNLLQMFFGWEGVGLCSYLLIGFWYQKPSAGFAAIKAFLVNRVGDFGFVLGIFGCFLLFRSIQFDVMFKEAPKLATLSFVFLGHNLPALTTLCLLLFVGAMGKSAQLGLHTWLPDAMEGPTPVSALIHAATMVTAGVFMIARMSPVFEYAPTALMVVAVVGALTAIVAASIGLTQFDIKRVIAYSTMSQLGYMFFALGVSAYSAAIFHLVTHAFFKALLFLAAGSVIHALDGEQDMRKMGGLWRKTPVTYALMWIGSLALAGIGIDGVFGFAGFYSKDFILESALKSHQWFGLFAYVLGILAAFMTAFYSLRLIVLTFHGKARVEHHPHESPWIMLAPLMPLAAGALFAGAYANDWFAGKGSAAFWHNALFVLPRAAVDEAAPYALVFLPLVVALAGMFLAYVFYGAKPTWPSKTAAAFGALYRLVFNKYYFDEMYAFVFVRGAQRLGYAFWKKGDDGVIDRFGPDGVAALAVKLGRRAGALQTGYVYHYAFVMVIGLAGLVTWVWARG